MTVRAGPGAPAAAPEEWTRQTLRALRALGGRRTEQRRRILAAIDAAPGGISAEELVAEVGGAAGPAARSTVYRTLDSLRQISAIDLVHPTSEHHRYVARRSPHQHHIVCETCGGLAVVDGCAFDAMIAALERSTGYRITRHTLEVFGRCANCRAGATAGAGTAA